MSRTQVGIVGAGPSGLLLAQLFHELEIARRAREPDANLGTKAAAR